MTVFKRPCLPVTAGLFRCDSQHIQQCMMGDGQAHASKLHPCWCDRQSPAPSFPMDSIWLDCQLLSVGNSGYASMVLRVSYDCSQCAFGKLICPIINMWEPGGKCGEQWGYTLENAKYSDASDPQSLNLLVLWILRLQTVRQVLALLEVTGYPLPLSWCTHWKHLKMVLCCILWHGRAKGLSVT